MDDRRPFFVLVGDSITQQGFNPRHSGWAAFLADQYQNKVDIINRGFSGYTSRWWVKGLLARTFPLIEGGHHPSLVTVFLGVNDTCLPGEFQHVPLSEYKENLKKIVAHLKGAGKVPHVIIVSPPPVDAPKWKEHRKLPKADRELENTALYAKAAEEVAKESDSFFIDLFHSMLALPNWQSLLSDGLHFSAEGNSHLSNELTKLIAEKIPSMSPNNIPFAAPYWADIKPDTFDPPKPTTN